MPRRKTHKIVAKETDFYELLVSELQLMNPQLVAEYDMESIEISMKKKIVPQIHDIDRAIENLKRHLPTYRNEVEVFEGEPLVRKKDIARLLGITRPTLDKWIREGFVKPIKSKLLQYEYYYPPEEILEQLLKAKTEKYVK